ncbi:ArsR/SmtB family transcription factor [Mesorhizobium cantuariense]|uniref:ArsR/SmtB family transcription factor n=1 Tax=Mesorhizobium cantuariense TaxID=1300275 RepID=A0ABV7MTY3_9HYPH
MVSINLLINAREAADFLSLMGSPPRLLIMAHLLDGEVSVNVLGKRLEISQPLLSMHLAKLRTLGLVDTRRDSQFIYYSCKSNVVRKLFSTLEALYGEDSVLERRRLVTAAS